MYAECVAGEIGLDGGCRVRWPKHATGVYDRWTAGGLSAAGSQTQPLEIKDLSTAGDDGNTSPGQNDDAEALNWQALTPFKVSMKHQVAIAQAQLELAIEYGINVSFHSVSAPGTCPPTAPLIRSLDLTDVVQVLQYPCSPPCGISTGLDSQTQSTWISTLPAAGHPSFGPKQR